MDKIHAGGYRVPPGKKIDLGKWPTKVKPLYDSKEEYRSLLADHIAAVLKIQADFKTGPALSAKGNGFRQRPITNINGGVRS